jgi:hypothetical protein
MENKHKTNQEKAAYIALQSVYWLATEDIAHAKFKFLMNLLNLVDVPDVQYLNMSDGVNYNSWYSCLGFLEALSDTVEEETNKAILLISLK